MSNMVLHIDDYTRAYYADCPEHDECLLVTVKELVTDWEVIGTKHLDADLLYNIVMYDVVSEEPEEAWYL